MTTRQDNSNELSLRVNFLIHTCYYFFILKILSNKEKTVMKTNKIFFSHTLFFAASFFLFFFDVSVQLIWTTQHSFFLFLFFITHVLHNSFSFKTCFLISLLCAQSLLFTNTSWLPLFYAPCIIAGIRFAQHRIAQGPLFPFGMGMCSLIFIIGINGIATGSWLPMAYTMGIVCGNLIIIGIGSLIFKR